MLKSNVIAQQIYSSFAPREDGGFFSQPAGFNLLAGGLERAVLLARSDGGPPRAPDRGVAMVLKLKTILAGGLVAAALLILPARPAAPTSPPTDRW